MFISVLIGVLQSNNCLSNELKYRVIIVEFTIKKLTQFNIYIIIIHISYKIAKTKSTKKTKPNVPFLMVGLVNK